MMLMRAFDCLVGAATAKVFAKVPIGSVVELDSVTDPKIFVVLHVV